MPEQPPDKLVNQCPDVDFGRLHLYGIVAGDEPAKPRWNNQYPFIHPPRPTNEAVCARLWRGYVAYYRLTAEGRLVLERYEYPYDHNQPDDYAGEVLEGNFWLLMKESFYSNCTYVPFVDGVIVRDPDRWKASPCDVETGRGRKGVKRRRARMF